MSNRPRRLQRLSTFILCSAVGAASIACGETERSGGSGGSGAAGSSGAAGAAAAGSSSGGAGAAGGASAECPQTVPQHYEACDAALNPQGCSYSAECVSGTTSFTFTCGTTGQWLLAEQACDHQAERCSGVPVSCNQGYWAYWTGVNPQPTCPGARPEGGAPCTPNDGECGYFCADGTTWTVLYCNGQTWVSDAACSA